MDAQSLVDAHASFTVMRQAVTYGHEDVTRKHEESVYVLLNESQAPVDLVALPPRLMEIQPDMTARIDGRARGSIVPSGEVRRRLLADLKEAGVSQAARDAWDELLKGGQPRVLDEQRSERVDRARRGLDEVEMDAEREAFFDHLLRAKQAGKYVPFVALPEPVQPGRFALIEFSRRRVEGQSASWSEKLLGRYEIDQRFPIGVGHSVHVSVNAPPGTRIRERRTPPEWPEDVGVQTDEADRWNLYLSVDAKQRIYREKEDEDPLTMDGLASLVCVLPTQVYVVSAFLLLMLALVPCLLFQQVVTPEPPGMAALIALYILVGGIYVPVLMARSEEPPAFRYMLKTGAVMAVLALWWVGAGNWRPDALAPLIVGVLAALAELGILAYNHA